MLFCYLLWNGYFSIDKSYAYNSGQVVDEDNTVFLGRGCCRHNATLLSEVLMEMDIYSKKIGLRVFGVNLKNSMDIERRVEYKDSAKDRCSRKSYNHSGSLVNDYSSWYILDPTMLTECEVISGGKLVCINGRYRISKKLLLHDVTHYSLYSPYKKHSSIDKKQILNYHKIANNICCDNTTLFDDFFDYNYSNYKKIKQLLLADK